LQYAAEQANRSRLHADGTPGAASRSLWWWGLSADAKENAMSFRLLVMAALWLIAGHAITQADDRPPTDAERAKLTAAMQAAGCSGGSMEVDDDTYEVDDARCADGRDYDLKFDKSFNLIKKDADD
jgi:hypothetical protein